MFIIEIEDVNVFVLNPPGMWVCPKRHTIQAAVDEIYLLLLLL